MSHSLAVRARTSTAITSMERHLSLVTALTSVTTGPLTVHIRLPVDNVTQMSRQFTTQAPAMPSAAIMIIPLTHVSTTASIVTVTDSMDSVTITILQHTHVKRAQFCKAIL
jgi:hypothetical protein